MAVKVERTPQEHAKQILDKVRQIKTVAVIVIKDSSVPSGVSYVNVVTKVKAGVPETAEAAIERVKTSLTKAGKTIISVVR